MVAGRSLRATKIGGVLLSVIALSACGWHLRGSYTPVDWPSELKTTRVIVANSESAYDPLRLAVVSALEHQAKVKVITGLPPDKKDFATIVLDREVVRSEPLTVTPSNVKVAQVLILYGTGLTLYDANGQQLMEPQLIRLRRHYEYDPSAVVAKRYEQDELVQVMRDEAAQQILERLSAWRPKRAEQR